MDVPRSADVCASGSQSGGCATWSGSGGFDCLASRMSRYVVMDVGVEGPKNANGIIFPDSTGHGWHSVSGPSDRPQIRMFSKLEFQEGAELDNAIQL